MYVRIERNQSVDKSAYYNYVSVEKEVRRGQSIGNLLYYARAYTAYVFNYWSRSHRRRRGAVSVRREAVPVTDRAR